MARIFLISCASKKRGESTRAGDLYVSALFSKSKELATFEADKWYILSAKHGLLRPDQIIGPYDKTLHRMTRTERHHWAQRVLDEVKHVSAPSDNITILAGSAYREMLVPELEDRGYAVSVPMLGLSIGNQLKWLTERLERYRLKGELDQFYELLALLESGLGGKRTLRCCQGKMEWPPSGVYLFFESGEFRQSETKIPRVVRVGTHAVSAGATSSLWGRLRTHRGAPNGSGNHRGSIFRLHVGAALLERLGGSQILSSWGVGQTAGQEAKAAENWLELKVSEYLGSMSLLWLAIGDTPGPLSDRAFIERNAISLLSNHEDPFDPPSNNWLGLQSVKSSIRKSGLWNVRHTNDDYNHQFLKVLEQYIDVTLGKRPAPSRSIAPKKRKVKPHLTGKSNQLTLFKGEPK
jgi:hypothetical protein